MSDIKTLVVVISAPGGTGKSTIMRKYLEGYKDKENVEFIRSYTSRAPRTDDIPGLKYIFVSRDEFQSMIDNGELLEYVEFGGNYYGTPLKSVLDNVGKKEVIIMELDYKGAMNLKSKLPEAALVFILPPSFQELKKRLENRGSDTQERIRQRLEIAEKETSSIRKFDFFIINDELNNAVNGLEEIITKLKEAKYKKGDIEFENDVPELNGHKVSKNKDFIELCIKEFDDNFYTYEYESFYKEQYE